MNNKYRGYLVTLTLIFLVSISERAYCSNSIPSDVSASGVVTNIVGGILYLDGFQYRIASVKTQKSEIKIAIPVSMNFPLKVGEHLVFSGSFINLGKDEVLDTRTGFVFRESEGDYQSFIEGMMKNAQTQADELAKKGIPNAIPTTIMETEQQKKEKVEETESARRDRKIDLILTIMGLILGILSLDRAATSLMKLWHWLSSRRKLEKPQPHVNLTEKHDAQQENPADGE